MIMGRIVLLTDGECFSSILPTWLTKIFVAGGFLGFVVQRAGGSVISVGYGEKLMAGETMIVAGLFVQTTVFGIDAAGSEGHITNRVVEEAYVRIVYHSDFATGWNHCPRYRVYAGKC